MAAQNVHGAQTVLGAPLEPGERVIYFHKASYVAAQMICALVGALLLGMAIDAAVSFGVWMLLLTPFGAAFLVGAVFYKRLMPRGQVVTDRRVIQIDREGVAAWLRLGDAVDLVAVRQESGGPAAGVVGALVGAALSAVLNHMARKHSKAEPGYWKRAMAISLVSRSGQRFTIPARKPQELGPFLARCVQEPGAAERAPAVPFEP